MKRRPWMSRRRWEIDRRALLRGAGAAIALPAFDLMVPSAMRAAHAAGVSPHPKRALWFYRACGHPIPGDSQIAYEPGASILAARLGGRYAHLHGLRLTDGQWSTSTEGGRPALNGGHTPRMLVILSATQASWIAGTNKFAVRPTINNVLARALGGQAVALSAGNRASGSGLEVPKVALFHGYALSKATLDENNPAWQPDPQYTNPRELFNLLFSGGGAAAGDGSGARVASKRSILDGTLEEIAAMRRKLAGADLARLEEYANSIREVERRLAGAGAGAPPSCNPGAPPVAYPNDINALDSAGTPTRLDLMERLVILGLQCNRLATVHFQYVNMMSSCDWVPGWDNTGSPRNNMHAISHHDGLGNAARAASELKNYKTVVDYFYGRFGDFARKLTTIPDLDGRTLFQNSVCIQYSEVPTGPSHTGGFIIDLAGELGGTLKPGPGKLSLAGREIADVWATLMHAATGGAVRQFGRVVKDGGQVVVGSSLPALLA